MLNSKLTSGVLLLDCHGNSLRHRESKQTLWSHYVCLFKQLKLTSCIQRTISPNSKSVVHNSVQFQGKRICLQCGVGGMVLKASELQAWTEGWMVQTAAFSGDISSLEIFPHLKEGNDHSQKISWRIGSCRPGLKNGNLSHMQEKDSHWKFVFSLEMHRKRFTGIFWHWDPYLRGGWSRLIAQPRHTLTPRSCGDQTIIQIRINRLYTRAWQQGPRPVADGCFSDGCRWVLERRVRWGEVCARKCRTPSESRYQSRNHPWPLPRTIMLQDDPCLDHLSQAMHHDPGQLHEGHCKHVGVEKILNVVLKEGLLWGQFIQ